MLQTRTVEPRTLELLKQLMRFSEIRPFYLVGGTALALQLGHRKSIQKPILLDLLYEEFDISIDMEGDNMIISYLNNVKVDFVKMSYPVLFPTLEIEGVRMLEIRDIAPMKLKAITQRGSKKDFFDIYFLLEELPLELMLELFKKKFTQYEIFHVVKSLTYFQDAEQYADPVVFDTTVTWENVKKKITQAVKELI